ncbi:MAG: DegT/DnrJ/EryC1/StrS family aminotransferase [Minisyncoccia bacterium]
MFDSRELAINGGNAVYPDGLKRGRVFGKEEKQAVCEVMEKGVVSRAGCGEKVQLFEKSFADYHGVRYAIATTSGTTALHTALDALGIGPGDEVIVPDLTFISTASAVMQTGAHVVFCDIDVDTFNMSAEDLERRITPKTKAVIVVHLYGAPADIASILAVTRKHNLWLVEDCAQAHGAKFDDQLVGTFGVISCFSFYQSKNMSCGEGGMVITDNEDLGRRARSITRHGLIGDDLAAYDYDKLGYNYAMTELHAAIGIVQLGKLEQMNEQRSINAALYRKELAGVGMKFQRDIPGHANHYLTAVLPELYGEHRGKFLAAVRAEGGMINCLYPIALSRTKLFTALSDKPEISDRVATTLFNLYVNPDVSDTFVRICCDAIKKVLKSNKGG